MVGERVSMRTFISMEVPARVAEDVSACNRGATISGRSYNISHHLCYSTD